jgi:PhoD-like phosphatase
MHLFFRREGTAGPVGCQACELCERLAVVDPGVVYEDIDGAEVLLDGADELLHIGFAGDIGLYGECAQPYDRGEGYAAERKEILDFIRSHRIENVVFLTTDIHANLINQAFVDRFADPQPIAQEFTSGSWRLVMVSDP